jgi:hypothetical protein
MQPNPREPARAAPTTIASQPRLSGAFRPTAGWIDIARTLQYCLVSPYVRHASPQVTSAFEILFEIPHDGMRQTNQELMGRLEGKSVIITGAGSGIGRAASLLF